MSVTPFNRILLTGPPGIGKTTAVQNVCNLLKIKNVPVIGFYTKEVRNNRIRIGFDVVTTDGKTGILARIKECNESKNATPLFSIGKYAVFVREFESLVMPLFEQQRNKNVIFVIDEIGKMELFSDYFLNAVKELFKAKDIKIIATIPETKNLPIIKALRAIPNTMTITLDYSNRNNVPKEILNFFNI